jgi:hypothetical protein
MNVCTCEKRELLSIEDRLEGLRRVYCENFGGCGSSMEAEGPLIEATLPETSGLVYLRAVSDQLKTHHTLGAYPGLQVSTPMRPAVVTLAPRRARRLVVPLLGVLGLALASVVATVVTLDLSRGPREAAVIFPGRQVSGLLAGDPVSADLLTSKLRISPEVIRLGMLPPDPPSTPAVACEESPRSAQCSLPRAHSAPPKRRRPHRPVPAVSPQRPRKPKPKPTPTPTPAPVLAPTPTPTPVLASMSVASGIATPDLGPVRARVGATPVTGPSLEHLLKAATGKTGTVMPSPEVLPERLGPRAVMAVGRQLRRRAAPCLQKFGFTHVTAQVRVRLRGDRGRVTWAKVRGRLQGTPAGRCIERVARHLRTTRFSQSRQTLTLPIRVH